MIINIKGNISISIGQSRSGLRLVLDPAKIRENAVPDTIFRVADDMQFDLNAVLSDRVGNPLGDLPTNVVPQFASSDPSILTVTPHSDNAAIATVATTGKLGTAQISVTATNPSKPDTPMTGMLNIEVVPGEASTLALTPTNLQSRTI